MSGHSKWANIKHRKDLQDAKRSKLFAKLSKAITVAALKGADPDKNSALKLAISKAKTYSMPKKNINNAIHKIKDNVENIYKELAYGTHIYGIAFLITCLTDNVNRTTAEIQNLVAKFNGTLTSANAVFYIFNLKGVLEIDNKKISEEDLLEQVLESGAEDLKKTKYSFLIYTNPSHFWNVKKYLETHNINDFITAEIKYIANKKIKLPSTKIDKVLNFLEYLDNNSDIQNVYHNLDISNVKNFV